MQFLDILDKYGIDHRSEGHHHCRAGWLQIDCPYCGRGSEKWHMGYSLAGRYVNCWRCGPHPLLQTLELLTGEPLGTCRRLLAGLPREEFEDTVELASGKLTIPKGVGPLLKPHVRYLKSRRYDPDELQALWGLAGIGLAARLSWRLFIPIMLRDEMVSWTTRSLVDDGLRYISAKPSQEKIKHKQLLYGEQYARNCIIIVEGPFDVWRIGCGAVATLGTGFSRSQVERMVRFPRRAVCFDSEPEAQRRASELCGLLQDFPGETFNVELDGKDASASQMREIRALRRELLK